MLVLFFGIGCNEEESLSSLRSTTLMIGEDSLVESTPDFVLSGDEFFSGKVFAADEVL